MWYDIFMSEKTEIDIIEQTTNTMYGTLSGAIRYKLQGSYKLSASFSINRRNAY